MINIQIKQSFLSSYKNLVEAIDKTKAIGGTFDMFLTPVKGEEGQPDTLTIEISRTNCYGYVVIKEGITVTDGSGESVLISSKSFSNLPLVPSDDPVTLEVTDKVYVSYPAFQGMRDMKFDMEYSENPGSFQRRPAAAAGVVLNEEGYFLLKKLIEEASKYVEDKRLDDVMSVVNLSLNEAGVVTLEASQGTDCFFAETQLPGCNNSTEAVVTCMQHPAIWAAGLSLYQGDLISFGLDRQTITFISGNCVLSHSRIAFDNFPGFRDLIRGWIENVVHNNFNATFNPALLNQRLKVIEPMGQGSRSAEPSFVFTPRSAAQMDKALIKLQGFIGSGQIVVDDPVVLDIAWLKEDAKVRIPSRVAKSVMDTCTSLGICNFFDIEGVNPIFFSNPEETVFVLIGQEED